MVGRQLLISRMDQVQILTGVNVHADTMEIFAKLVGINKCNETFALLKLGVLGKKISHKNTGMEDARPG